MQLWTSRALTVAILAFTSALASADVTLEGIHVTRRDFIAGRVYSSAGAAAKIDLGYEIGLERQQRVWVFRYGPGGYERVNIAILERVNQKTSLVTSLSGSSLKANDVVVVSAGDLQIWGKRGQTADIEFARIIERRRVRSYDTRRNAAGREGIMRRLDEDEELRRAKFRGEKLTFRPEGPALIDLTEIRKLETGEAIGLGSDIKLHFAGVDFAKGRIVALDPKKLEGSYKIRKQVVAARLDRKLADFTDAEFRIEDNVDPLEVHGYTFYRGIVDFLRP
ncbi:MAG: hypothetical protein O3A00_24795, partial [Planctomycetota bacterium]|nr:hypothetical protein [Planctomycetota bacterium]